MEYSNLAFRRNKWQHFVWAIGLMLFVSMVFSACQDQRTQTITRVEYQPIYMSEADFINAVDMEAPRKLNKPGKIYLYDSYLFVNEVNKGVHIINNEDPANPSKVGFINIPANKDIAVKGDILYADSNSDLLVFDISDVQNTELITRKEDVFQRSANQAPGFPSLPVESSKGVVVDWKRIETQEVCKGDCYDGRGGVVFDGGSLSNVSAEAGGTGMGGSMARFAITGDYLYAVDDRNLLTYDIASPDPSQKNAKEVGWSIETIFPHKQNLFVGSRSAMYIYDISNPDVPLQLSRYDHFTACDPVVVEGDLAYVTLRSNPQCPQGLNRLEIIDVQDLTKPKRISFYEMENPHGLGIDDGKLFISEGDHGLKILDANDPEKVTEIRFIKDIQAKDVIPYNDVLIVTGPNGIYQYDYSDINNLQQLSMIPIVGEE